MEDSGLVEAWGKGVSVNTFRTMTAYLNGFLAWVRAHGEFTDLTEMVSFQENANGRDRYRVIDLLTEYVREKGGAYNGMRLRYSSVRSFFLHSRAELPKVAVNFSATRDAAVGRLNLEIFMRLVEASTLRWKAIYLCLFQGLMDQAKFMAMNRKYGFALGEHIKRGVNEPFRIDLLMGRKRNPRPYNTWLGEDALTALKKYFELDRGYPKEGEAAVLDDFRKPVTQVMLTQAHLRLLRRLKLIGSSHDSGQRYGLNLHEIRDLARSQLEKLKGEKTEGGEPFNVTSAEHWMGHRVDPLFYNKIWSLDPDYNLSQYRHALKALNILSGGGTVGAGADVIQSQEEFGKLVKKLKAYGFVVTREPEEQKVLIPSDVQTRWGRP